jgi:cobyrinic acid a,c-diamide synthase
MSVPRLLLVPTHRTVLADAVAAALAEVFVAQGQQVRYHRLGPVGPAGCWDRWEGSSFLDPALYGEEALLGLYEAATRGADLSLLSTDWGILDRPADVAWSPVDVARTLDCPVLLLVDCRGWGNGLRLLTAGLRTHLGNANLAGVLLTGVADQRHLEQARAVFAGEGLPVVGCLFDGDGPAWDAAPPGAWGLPLDPTVLDAVARQVDLRGVVKFAGQRGYLPSQGSLTDRSAGGPLVAVAGGKGFALWSRDSIEVLRSAGAQVRRLDLLDDSALPDGTAGLILAGTVWPDVLADIAMNTSLLDVIARRIQGGLPTLALGGGALLLLDKVQDLIGRTSDLAGVLHAEAEILWEYNEPVRVQVRAERDNLLLARGETVPGWVLTDAEVTEVTGLADREGPALSIDGGGSGGGFDGHANDSLVCTTTLIHLAARPGLASRFVRRCAAYGSRHSDARR